MTNSNSANLDRFFIGLCENVFHARLGVADEPLVDYLSDLILRFVRFDQIHRVRNLAGRPAHEVADMMSEAEQRVGHQPAVDQGESRGEAHGGSSSRRGKIVRQSPAGARHRASRK